ncbi:MAG: ABC transporter substrate-binding protein [Actinomycetes bacterium]
MTLGTFRHGVLLAGAVALALALGGCGGVGSGGGGGSGAATQITTMGFGLPDEIATVRVQTYEKQSGVHVKVNEGDFDEQQFLSAVASGNPPDVVRMDRNVIGTYAARGALQPLDQCIKDAGVDMSAFRKPAVEQVTMDGKVWGLPEFYSVRVVIANDSVMQQAGLTIDQVATGDWQQIAAADKAMSAMNGGKIVRIGYDSKILDFLPMWAAANGAQILSEDGKKAQLDDPKVVEAVEFGASLVQQQGGWAAVKAFRDSWDFFGEKNEYAMDQLGAMPMEDWYVNQLAEVSKGPSGVTVAPFKDRQGNPITYASGSAWAIPKDSAHPKEACEFINTMTKADTWVAAATARAAALRAKGASYTGTYTGNEKADKVIFSEIYKPVEDPALDAAVKTVLSVQDKAFSLPASPASAEFENAYKAGLNRVLEGQQTAQQAMAQAQQEAQKALDAAAGS